MLGRAKAVKSKNLLTELECKKQNKVINNELIKESKESIIELKSQLIQENKTIDFSNNLLKYNNENIKFFNYNNNIYFKAKDIALLLEYKDTDDSIRDHVDNYDKFNKNYFLKNDPGEIPGSSNNTNKMNKYTEINSLLKSEHPNTIFINESGLYSLIFGSKKTEAHEFKHWVTSQVLPSIRKNGYYKTRVVKYGL
jgi:anti-repressor protein